jgi:hypothetical protein
MNEKSIGNLTREQYLLEAVKMASPLFKKAGYEIPQLRVSVGFPSRGALSRSKRVIGQCWGAEASKDGIAQIFISPLLEEVCSPDGVFPTLIHEVGHAVVGVGAKHGPLFRKCAVGVGLTGKMTATVAGEELLEQLSKFHDKLGAYPHVKLDPSLNPVKKQGTRMIKCECPDCGYVVRTSQKWLDIATPTCPLHEEMLVA